MRIGFNNRAHLEKLHGDAPAHQLMGGLGARQAAPDNPHNVWHLATLLKTKARIITRCQNV
jgi:hypothetical protein